MKIHGLQKMTLLDFPGRVACTVFLGGCDFRCPFCHNFELADGSAKPVMEEEELLSFLKKRQGLLDGVAFTGGEPCLHRDLPDLIRRIRELGFAVKLDTNGYHPRLLQALLEEGLIDYAAMDIKNCPERYAETVGLNPEVLKLENIRESVRYLMTGDVPYEFRTTVVRELHTRENLLEIAEWIRGADRYYLQQYTDSGNVIQPGWTAYSSDEMKELCAAVAQIVPTVELRGVKEG